MGARHLGLEEDFGVIRNSGLQEHAATRKYANAERDSRQSRTRVMVRVKEYR